MRFVRLTAFVILATVLLNWSWAQSGQHMTWLCYYDKVFGIDEYGRFDLVVFDSVNHPVLRRYGPGKPLLIGYVSVGEEKLGGPAWELIQNKDFVLGHNEHWNSSILDIRNEQWQSILLDTVIPGVIAQGFDGIFLDTLDSPLALEETDKNGQYKGMDEACVAFIQKIRARFPEIKIIQNRALSILPQTSKYIDYILIESLYCDYDFEQKHYTETNEETRSKLRELIKVGTQGNPTLTVLTLEYASSNQTSLIEDAINYSRSNGFVPYVSTIELNQIFYHTLQH